MDRMDNVKKRIIISMCAIVMLILTLVGITFAYFFAKIVGNTNEKSIVITAGRLELTYGDGNNTIVVNNLIPGKTIESKTFTVENTGTGLVENYDVYLENVINELESYEDLTYVLECTTDNGICNGSSGVFPKSDTVIVTNSIDVDVIHNYKLTITYNETNKDQSNDMNKTIRAKVNIKDDVANFKTFKIYGNSIQNGTPSPTNPVDIVSLGNKTKNLFDRNKVGNPEDWEVITYRYYPVYVGAGNTVTVSYKNNLENGLNFYFCVGYTEEQKGIAKGSWMYHSSVESYLNNQVTVVAQSDYIYLNMFGNYENFINNILENDFQIEINSKSTDYEPYGYEIPISVPSYESNTKSTISIYLDEPLRKVGNYADYIDLENRKVVRKVAKGIIDENSSFGKFSNVTNYSAFYMSNSNLINYKNHGSYNVELLSNTFTNYSCGGGNVDSFWSNNYQICGSLAGTYTRVDFTLPNTITDVASAKNWLETNPIEYFYPLESPIVEKIDIPDFSFDKNSTIQVCSDNNVCASNIEVEFD